MTVVCDYVKVLSVIARYQAQWQHIEAELTGHDLRTMGVARGAIYRTILAGLRAGRLDGTIGSRQDEIEYVERTAALAK